MRGGRVLPSEAAAFLGCSAQTVRLGIRQGFLPIGTAVRSGGRWQYIIDLDALIAYKRSADIIRGEGRDGTI